MTQYLFFNKNRFWAGIELSPNNDLESHMKSNNNLARTYVYLSLFEVGPNGYKIKKANEHQILQLIEK